MALTQVSTSGIKDATVATADIANDAITNAKIADNAIQTAQISNGSVTLDKMAASSVNNSILTVNAVQTDAIVDANVTTAKIADNAITTAKIANNAITTAKLASGVQTTINNNADDRVITGSGTANTLNAESGVTINSAGHLNVGAAASHFGINLAQGDYSIHKIGWSDASSNKRASIACKATGDVLVFNTGTSDVERMRINAEGDVLIGRTSTIDTSEVFGVQGPSGDHCTFGMTTNGTTNLGIISFNDTDANFRGQIRYHHSSDSMQFWTNGANERMRIDSTGRVGIGTDSPSAMLHVYKIHHYVPTDSGKATGGIHVRGQCGNAGEYGGGISFSCGDGDSSSAIAVSQEAQDCDVTGLGFFVHESSDGSHDAVERLRINNKGLVQAKGRAGNYFGAVASNEYHVFNNTGNGKFVMQLHQEHHGGHGLRLRQGANNNNEAMDIVDYSNSGVQRFKISNNGDVKNTNNSYGSLSDISLKGNIVDAKSQWEDIKAIKVRNFNFKETPDKKLIGVVAQEIETVCSGLVYEDNVKDPDDTSKITGKVKSVRYSVLYMKAIKALQEAITRIEALEAKVA